MSEAESIMNQTNIPQDINLSVRVGVILAQDLGNCLRAIDQTLIKIEYFERTLKEERENIQKHLVLLKQYWPAHLQPPKWAEGL